MSSVDTEEQIRVIDTGVLSTRYARRGHCTGPVARGLMVTALDLSAPASARGRAEHLKVDGTDWDAGEAAMAHAVARGRVPDVLVATHGIRGRFVPAVELEPDRVRESSTFKLSALRWSPQLRQTMLNTRSPTT